MPSGQHYAFLTLARERGLLRPEDAGRLANARLPAPEAAVEQGLLSAETAQALVETLSQGRFACEGCGQSCGYRHLATLTSLACPRCAAPLRHQGASEQGGSGLGPDAPRSGLGRPPSARRPADRPPSERLASGLGRPPSARRPADRPPSERLGTDQTQVRSRGLKRIGDYELERELGRGNNGVVYLARRSGLERCFALKVLLKSAALGPEARERFLQEAKLGARLDHPGIVSVYDAGEADDLLYFTMEYCEGEDLAQRLKREGKLPQTQAAELVRDLADAMSAAHARDVLHRDLKPGNVLLGSAGRPRITDFGLARDQLAATMTKSGDVLGTPFYMAPEQLQGARPSAQVDVYALGVILYECLTGQLPHTAKSPFELAKKVLSGQVVPPLHYLPELSPALNAICLRALALSPAERTSGAAALRDELEAFLAGREPGPSSPRAGLLPKLALALVLLVLAAGGGLLYASHRQSEQARADLLRGFGAEEPSDEDALAQGLERLRRLGLDEARLVEAEAQAAAWRKLWEVQGILREGRAAGAKAALLEIAPRSPGLSAALERAAAQIAHEERRQTLEAECRGRPLDGPLLGRWRELVAQASAPDQADRFRRAFLEHLCDRLLVDEYREAREPLLGDARARADLTLAWLRLERGQATAGRGGLEALLARQGTPRSLQLAAQGILSANRVVSAEALPPLDESLALDPTLLPARVCRLAVLQVVGRDAEGDQLLRELLRDHPDSAALLTWSARIQVSAGQGVAPVERALTILGERPTERALLAGILAAHVAREEAAFARYVALGERHFPGSIRLAFAFGLVLSGGKRAAEGLEVWRTVYKRDPAGFREAALSLVSKRDAEQILGQLSQAAAPRQGPFLLPLGETPAPALQLAQAKVAQIAVPAARAPAQLALKALVAGKPYAAAEPHFAKALEAAPRDPALALLIAEANFGRDRLPAAEEALSRCAELGVSARRIALLRAGVAFRLGRRAASLELLARLSAPDAPRDAEWHCAKALHVVDTERGPNSLPRALELIERAPPNDPFAGYVRVRLALYNRAKRSPQDVLQERFLREGLSDTSTLLFYALEQTYRLFSGQARQGLLEHVVFSCERLFRISEGAWVHLAFANLLVGIPLRDAWVLDWTRDRLDAADRIQPDRMDSALFRGCYLLRRKRPPAEAVAYWLKARELGATTEELREVVTLFQRELEGTDLSQLLAPR